MKIFNRRRHRGRLFVISAPSGAGKTTLCRLLREHVPELAYSVSTTTRPPRSGELEGADYFFVDKKTFQKGMENGQWAEWAEVHGNYYGTSAAFLSRCLREGTDVLLDIDVQGAAQIVSCFPEAVTIFVMPPSVEALKQRLLSRGTDDAAEVEKRLQNAREETARKDDYRHVIVNDRLEDAVETLVELVRRYRDEIADSP